MATSNTGGTQKPKDSELRATVLQWFYDHRREGWIEPNDSALPPQDFFAICDQLREHSLIEWKPLRSMGHTIRGMGKITAFGVDAVESEGHVAGIKLAFPVTQNFSFNGQSNVQVGNNNSQSIVQTFNNLIEKIEASAASEEEKKEAKSRLKAFLEHPLVSAVVGGAAGGISGLL